MIRAASPPLILASGSTTRRALLEAAGLAFSVQPVDVDEGAIKQAAMAAGATPDHAALTLAHAKAARVTEPGSVVIGADQILVCGERWFDKPRDVIEASSHLHALRGRTHTLVSAVACWRDGAAVWSHVATARLTMRACSNAFIASYLALEGRQCLASVGAYRIEGPGIQLFSHIEGEHSTILGLPLLPLLDALRKLGVLLR